MNCSVFILPKESIILLSVLSQANTDNYVFTVPTVVEKRTLKKNKLRTEH